MATATCARLLPEGDCVRRSLPRVVLAQVGSTRCVYLRSDGRAKDVVVREIANSAELGEFRPSTR